MDIKIDSELGNKIYDDGLKESVKETSKTISLIPRAIKAALLPLERWILNREYSIKETQKLLEEKLKNIPEEKIVPPELYVAVPAIQALSYSMNSEELRNMYANLLSNAMNTDVKDKVHPAFTDIIKQMSPIDASILKNFINQANNPLVDVIERNQQDVSYFILMSNLTNISEYDNLTISISIDNLLRLGLINIVEKHIKDTSAYDTITCSELFNEFKKTYNPQTGFEIDIIKKVLSITELGNRFSEICIQDLK